MVVYTPPLDFVRGSIRWRIVSVSLQESIMTMNSVRIRNLGVGFVVLAIVGATIPACSATARSPKAIPSTTLGGTLSVAALGLPATQGNPFGSFNGPSIQIDPAFFDTLTTGAPGTLQPDLALSWELIGTKTWRFTLRHGVKFSDGETFNAAAAAFTFNYLASAAGRATNVGSTILDLGSASVVSQYVLDLNMTRPDPIVPQEVDQVFIVAPKAWQREGPTRFGIAPVGTGPYQVTNWGPTTVTLKRFAEAWRPGHYRNVTYTAIADPNAAYQALVSGQVQVLYALSFQQLQTIKANRNLKSYSVPSGNTVALQFVTSPGSPIMNRSVRVAMNEAINRSLMQKSLFHGLIKAADQYIPAGIPGNDPQLPPIAYNPTAAKAAIAAAGYPHGFSLTLTSPAPVIPGNSEALQLVQAELAAVGVTITFNTIPYAVWLPHLLAGKFPGSQLTQIQAQITPSFDGANPLSKTTCASPTPAVWCEPANNQAGLITKAESELSLTTRTQLLAQVAKAQRTDPSVIPLFESPNTLGVSTKVAVSYEPIGTINWSTVAPA